jgi:catechol 2,3-dioxygenase-like lactoylglutathione lyase family enzyme
MAVHAVGIQHVQITVEPDDLERIFDFYTRLIGMPQIHDEFAPRNKGFWLGAGDQSLHVRIEKGIERKKTNAHPAIIVDNLAECKQGLEKEGHPIFPQPKLPGYERFHTIDPSGNRIEVMQRD